MHVDALERTWIWVVSILTAIMLGTIFYTAYALSVNPPSKKIQPIDSTRLHLTPEFAEDRLGVKKNPDGSLLVTVVATRYGFFPQHVQIPAGTPITFRFATPDVLHGLHIPGTNVDTMVIPGYISEVSTVIDYDSVKKVARMEGDKAHVPLFCNEYCGLGHHFMWSRVTVLPKT
jgi:cytochrome c oxidase subunit 2